MYRAKSSGLEMDTERPGFLAKSLLSVEEKREPGTGGGCLGTIRYSHASGCRLGHRCPWSPEKVHVRVGMDAETEGLPDSLWSSGWRPEGGFAQLSSDVGVRRHTALAHRASIHGTVCFSGMGWEPLAPCSQPLGLTWTSIPGCLRCHPDGHRATLSYWPSILGIDPACWALPSSGAEELPLACAEQLPASFLASECPEDFASATIITTAPRAAFTAFLSLANKLMRVEQMPPVQHSPFSLTAAGLAACELGSREHGAGGLGSVSAWQETNAGNVQLVHVELWSV